MPKPPFRSGPPDGDGRERPGPSRNVSGPLRLPAARSAPPANRPLPRRPQPRRGAECRFEGARGHLGMLIAAEPRRRAGGERKRLSHRLPVQLGEFAFGAPVESRRWQRARRAPPARREEDPRSPPMSTSAARCPSRQPPLDPASSLAAVVSRPDEGEEKQRPMRRESGPIQASLHREYQLRTVCQTPGAGTVVMPLRAAGRVLPFPRAR